MRMFLQRPTIARHLRFRGNLSHAGRKLKVIGELEELIDDEVLREDSLFHFFGFFGC